MLLWAYTVTFLTLLVIRAVHASSGTLQSKAIVFHRVVIRILFVIEPASGLTSLLFDIWILFLDKLLLLWHLIQFIFTFLLRIHSSFFQYLTAIIQQIAYTVFPILLQIRPTVHYRPISLQLLAPSTILQTATVIISRIIFLKLRL